jgi:hypothetical protein
MRMFFIPGWISSVLFLITCYLAGYQHVQLRRPNPILNLQFLMIVFSLLMILVGTVYNRTDQWLSLAFFLIAAGGLIIMIRQHRMLPPNKNFE